MPAVQLPTHFQKKDTPLTLTSLFKTKPIITWEKLPDDFNLPDDPVDNLEQPILAEALREAFPEQPNQLIATNFGIATTVNGKREVKAPDWVHVPSVIPLPSGQTYKSYTPYAQGALPDIVMEFLSDTEGKEYDDFPHHPYGKWYYYEQILKIPFYAIFEPNQGLLEVYELQGGRYQLLKQAKSGRYWIPPLELFLGVWQGNKAKTNRTGYWLRWWDAENRLLLWESEETQKVLTEKQVALAEKQAALEAALAEKQAALEKAKQAELAERTTKLQIAKQLLQTNLAIPVIMQITGLDEVSIKNL